MAACRMRVEIINTGTELLLGDVLNTHLRFVARAMFPLGLRIARQCTVPDGPAISAALSESFAAADIVIVTGGLGPTTDDITRDAAAELLGLPMREEVAVREEIAARVARFKFQLTDRIMRQAQVPAGAKVLPNPHGTAPGLYLPANIIATRRTPHLFLLPGPPRELQPMFEQLVLPILREIAPPSAALAFRTYRIAAVGESVIENKVGAQILRLQGIELGYCARPGEVDVRVIGKAEAVERAGSIIEAAFESSIFTTTSETLEAVVVRLLTERRLTLATAESCTGGYLAHRITNVPGASAIFTGGYVTYSNELKTELLAVPLEMLQTEGAVSESTATRMAEGAREHSRASFALATTGVAGPGGGTAEKPVGTLFVALASDAGATTVQKFFAPTDRETFKQMATQWSLEMLRRKLTGPPNGG